MPERSWLDQGHKITCRDFRTVTAPGIHWCQGSTAQGGLNYCNVINK